MKLGGAGFFASVFRVLWQLGVLPRGELRVVAGLALVGRTVGAILPALVASSVGTFTRRVSSGGALNGLAILTFLTVVAVVLGYLRHFWAVRAFSEIRRRCFLLAVRRLFAAPLSRIGRHGAGYWASRAEQAAATFSQFAQLLVGLGESVWSCALILGLSVALYWPAAIVTMAGALSFLVLFFRPESTLAELRRRAQQRATRKWERLTLLLENVVLVKSLGIEDRSTRQASRAYHLTVATEDRAQLWAARSSTGQALVALVFPLFSVLAAAWAHGRGDLSLEGFLAVAAYGMLVHGPVAQAAGFVRDISGLRQVVQDALDLVTLEVEEEPRAWSKPPLDRRDTAELEIKELWFGYDSEPVIAGAWLAVERGERVLVQGENGSGKTTLLRLIMGYHEPWKGTVSIAGVPLTELSRRELRRMVGFLWHTPGLLPGSISSNLRAANPDAGLREVFLSLEKVGFFEIWEGPKQWLLDSKQLRMGDLSLGQQQLLGWARILLRRPRILLVDEATNALSPEIERRVMETIEADLPGTTVVWVAHRPPTGSIFHRVCRLAEGRILTSSQVRANHG